MFPSCRSKECYRKERPACSGFSPRKTRCNRLWYYFNCIARYRAAAPTQIRFCRAPCIFLVVLVFSSVLSDWFTPAGGGSACRVEVLVVGGAGAALERPRQHSMTCAFTTSSWRETPAAAAGRRNGRFGPSEAKNCNAPKKCRLDSLRCFSQKREEDLPLQYHRRKSP